MDSRAIIIIIITAHQRCHGLHEQFTFCPTPVYKKRLKTEIALNIGSTKIGSTVDNKLGCPQFS